MMSSSDMVRAKVCFIVSPGHAGSTLLDLLLGSQAGITSLGEIGSLGYKFEDGRLPARICAVCEGICPVWDVAARRRLLEREFFYTRLPGAKVRSLGTRLSRLTVFYAPLREATASRVLVDSSKRLTWIRRQLRRSREWRTADPVFVVLHRDGRAVVNSWLRKYPERDLAETATSWAKQVEEIESFAATQPPDALRRLQYEDLCREPDKYVSEIVDWLGGTFEHQGLEYWRHDHHPVYGNAGTRSLIGGHRHASDPRREEFYERPPSIRLDERWKDELSEADLRVFDEAAGEVNEWLGYARGTDRP